ncbi:hypothetical protein [Streptomyces sp. NPDC051569]|uniref:hypothetical protein n=1 Tax=Streptomyces sp. NPDC051569 TaxID=3365661 RepID=UPI0037B86AB1
MSVASRPLLTAAAAGILLCALWFVPSAHATEELDAPEQGAAAAARSLAAGDLAAGDLTAGDLTAGDLTAGGPGSSREPALLAETGSVRTTPYLIGGSVLLGVGAVFVVYSAREGARVF